MTDVKNVLFVGVGGQGTILASKILTMGLIAHGYDVKMSEVHGMSQRGGSVSTQVRFGAKVYSPIIGEGTADILVSFEEMEAARYAKFLKKDGKIVVNACRIPSMPVLSGTCQYPEGVIAALQECVSVLAIDATQIASDLGNPKSANVVLLGALVEALGLHDIDWKGIISQTVKKNFVDMNLQAFEAGMAAM
ncbi:indolepyruvate oxidoreductase subunit beta [Megasphaera cerevisiae DSM 20462]|jgi:indolepyruvate ferredoxin oxidoreductase beta subunit|uniref:Indolepyruvate oxidoreductase subunit beta n=1 Tax=Megasphaera cerevisiae DSM 20462 TaxID=1122219 RepID=A0A0J6WYI7_9FIRM|nr:indolepyruvate oxidoreductase subunit beta [Megasphaera cerevisiae]KMO87709.1 indolepyruvate oxidoreductase subunit beta [Megasphaera cerevisiae DSM 20462]OKY53459.1 indolepyruvate oxidoreductase subunit beta [Megasphaera cerevisiae]SJZ75309.1 indolepyruvate ferredoxin oxidoreductase beta subunit [Megasphaera cerevisiae DSM 20462]